MFTIVKDGKTITFVPFSKTSVLNKCMKSENSHEDSGERRPSDSAKSKSLIKPVESGDKT
jgi:hypothetical protein